VERGDTGVLAAQQVNSRSDGRVDGDTVSRFATCCRALGIAVYERQRQADLAAARSGFTALTRIAHEQCDAWTGLAAAGDVSLRVLEATSRTATTAGRLQREVELAPGALGFRYDTGLYLQFRATTPDDFHLAYAAALASPEAGRFADADGIVSGLVARRPGWREARWVAVVINYRAERWSDVVKLLTPIVNDTDLDETFSHAAKITLGTALARLGMFAPALSYLEEPEGPVVVAAVDGALVKALVLRAHVDEESANEVLPCPTPASGSSRPPRPASTPAPIPGTPRPSRASTTSSTPRLTNARPCCCTRPSASWPNSSAWTRSKTRCRGSRARWPWNWCVNSAVSRWRSARTTSCSPARPERARPPSPAWSPKSIAA
jgi:hypothetical protein